MAISRIYPVNVLVSLAVGWVLLSCLHAMAACLLASDWASLATRFRALLLFQDRWGAWVNVGLALAIGAVASLAWRFAHP